MSDLNIAPAIHERKGHTPGPYMRDGALLYALDEAGQINRMSARFDRGYVSYSKGRTTDAELVATAEFAQRACNNHYELLEVLKEAYEVIDEQLCGEFPELIEAMRAAITKAEG